MSKSKTAGSQATWALLTEGVTRARLDSHRIRHMINRALKLVEDSEDKEHLYQIAGDIIEGISERMDQLDASLDRTGLALSRIGEEFLSARLTLTDKNLVDEAISSAFGSHQEKESEASERIVSKYLVRVTRGSVQ